MKPLVLASTNKIPASVIRLLEKHFSVDFLDDSFNSHNLKTYLQKNKNIFALMTTVMDKVDAEILQLCLPSLKIVSNLAVGFNNIDLTTCKNNGITVTNTPDVLTVSTAELTMALLLCLSRRIIEAHNFIQEDKFKGWKIDLLLGCNLASKKIGIIGLGRIGTAFAKRAQAFDMQVLYHNRHPRNQELDKKEAFTYCELEELLQESDFISLHLPLNTESKHIITAKELKMMKKSAFLINTARGECIKEADLVEALATGEIAGAALDVFEFEPQITEKLKEFPNVVLTPHIGSASLETRTKMAEVAAINVIKLYQGEEPLSRII